MNAFSRIVSNVFLPANASFISNCMPWEFLWFGDDIRSKEQVEKALRRNVKSYGAWYHRKWVIQFGLSSLEHEYQLLDYLLNSDARNFHGWSYRRWLSIFLQESFKSFSWLFRGVDCESLPCLPIPLFSLLCNRFLAKVNNMTEDHELDYTLKKINQNFSNYSAWHTRR